MAVLEVGMGGRLDATNIVDPLVAVITDISLDHTEWLGTTISAIAREKAGILRPNGVLITLPQHPEANQVIGEVATELNVRGVSAVPYMPQTARSAASRAAIPFAELASLQLRIWFKSLAQPSRSIRPSMATISTATSRSPSPPPSSLPNITIC